MYKINPVKPITPELVDEVTELYHKLGPLESKIIGRIHYIMLSIFNTFGQKNAYWYFYGAAEGEQGDFWRHYEKDAISIVFDNCPAGENMVILLKDGSEWRFDDSIPTRWLFEDFETELAEGKKKYQGKLKADKIAAQNKRFQQKQEDKKLAAAAKGKLTKQELSALLKGSR